MCAHTRIVIPIESCSGIHELMHDERGSATVVPRTAYGIYNYIIMPQCACAREVYGIVFVCVCVRVCVQTVTAAQGSMKCK